MQPHEKLLKERFDIIDDEPIDVEAIELERFLSSEEWQAICEILNEAEKDHISTCIDSDSDIEKIRFSQGALAAIDSFRGIPKEVFSRRGKEK